jgi:hypothetical protein
MHADKFGLYALHLDVIVAHHSAILQFSQGSPD